MTRNERYSSQGQGSRRMRWRVVTLVALSVMGASGGLATATPTPTQCSAPPTGLVSWYWMDGDADDKVDSNNPSATNAISFVAGKVGQGVTFGTGGHHGASED